MTLSAAEILVAISHAATVFRAADGDTGYATFAVNGHCETWPVRSKGFRRWLIGEFYKTQLKPPGGQAIADALGVIEARAQYGGAVHPVHVRLGGTDDAIYLDLVNDAWQAIEVTKAGWRVISDPPVKFRRARGMLPLPVPRAGMSINILRGLVNIEHRPDWALLVAWLVAALRPTGPYPVLALLGEQGTAKSTTQELLRALIDPNVAPLRSEPMDVRDVMIAASNGWCVSFDNISDIEPWLSDAVCRLATGGGFSTRQLYSDDDEMIFVAQRPVMLNGIDAVINRADLLDRAIVIDLPRIPDHQRCQRRTLWANFEAEHPYLLGALLDAVAGALKRQADVTLATLPRMADFAHWAVAAEPDLGLDEGEFLRAYTGNRAATHEIALEASPIAASVRKLAEAGEWKGTATELLKELDRIADDATKRAKNWPTTGSAIANALRRVAPNLRAVGIGVNFTDERGLGSRRRQIAIRTGGDSSVPTVPTVPDESGNDGKVPGNDGNGPGNDGNGPGNGGNGGNGELPLRSSSPMLTPPCRRHPITPLPDLCDTCRPLVA